MSEWRKVQMLLKVTPSQRSAMGGMPIRETDSACRAQLHAHAQESLAPAIIRLPSQVALWLQL